MAYSATYNISICKQPTLVMILVQYILYIICNFYEICLNIGSLIFLYSFVKMLYIRSLNTCNFVYGWNVVL